VSEFHETQRQLKGPGTTGWWVHVLADLDQTRKDQLIEAANDPAISHRAICIVLQRWGYPVTVPKVGHWRRHHVG
jgi:hypothetical protein